MPIASAVPAIIGAAGTIGGALLGGHKSSSENTALQGLSDLTNVEAQAGQQGLKWAGPELRSATGDLGAVSKFLTPLVAGNRTAAMQAAAPQVNSILSQYDTAKKSISEFSPRGGGTNSQLANMPFQESGAITNLLAGERTNASQSLANLGGTEGALASSLLPRDSGAGSSLLNYALGNKAQQGQMWGSIGTSLGTLLGGMFNNSGGGGGSTDISNLAGGIWGGPIGGYVPPYNG